MNPRGIVLDDKNTVDAKVPNLLRDSLEGLLLILLPPPHEQGPSDIFQAGHFGEPLHSLVLEGAGTRSLRFFSLESQPLSNEKM